MWSFFSRDVVKDFGYEIGSPVETNLDLSFWKLHDGKKKSTGEAVSVFSFEASTPDMQVMLDIAKGSVKRVKTLRHPSFLIYIDSLETDKLVYLVTEKVCPLSLSLNKNDQDESQKCLAISWGLYQIATGLSFLNKDCSLSHNNVCLTSVFVDRAGEWKLFGLEYVVPNQEHPPSKVVPALKLYNPPELESSSSSNHAQSRDSWGLGCLIWEVFNGLLTKSSSLKSTGKIPQDLGKCYSELMKPDPALRLSIPNFLKKASRPNGYFKNKFIETMLFLREIHIKDNDEKSRFFNNLSSSLDSFPQSICLYKVLPELINAFEFGNAGSSILSPMFKLGKLLSEEEYQQKIVPCVVKMFSSKDRSMRAKLLERMNEFIDHFTPAVINSQIFPNVVQGFLDSSPVIREYTIRCMFYLAPKLNYQNLNEEMLKHFARLQTKDEQGGIRSNTTVCLGKIASYLHPQTRKKVLINAFVRALRDPFPPARTAAILAFSSTENFYSISDCATRVLPALCHFTIDPEKSVRDQAFKSIAGFLQKLKKVSDDPSLAEEMEKELQSMTPSEAASSWTSWAVTSLVDKLHMPSLSRSSVSPTRSSNPENPAGTRTMEVKTAKEDATEPEVEETVEEEKFSSADDWDTAWGDDEDGATNLNDVPRSTSMSLKVESSNVGGEWDVEEWDSFETVESFSKDKARLSSYFPKSDSADPFSAINNEKSIAGDKDDFVAKADAWDTENADWGGWGDDPVPAATSPKSSERQQRLQEERQRREERRKQRQKEQMAKPKKLGAQKLS